MPDDAQVAAPTDVVEQPAQPAQAPVAPPPCATCLKYEAVLRSYHDQYRALETQANEDKRNCRIAIVALAKMVEVQVK